MLRQHGHHGERQRHFAIAPAKIEANRHKIERFRPFDPAEGITLLRPTLLLEEIEGEQHVGCAHRYAVRKPRPRVEAARERSISDWNTLPMRPCAVARTQVIRIEAVERPLVGERQMASFRRLRMA
jgi:hypothetical protein